MNYLKPILAGLLVVLLSSCSNIKPLEVKYKGIEGSGFYSTSAATKATVVRQINDGHIICSEPAPDATYDEEASAALELSFFNIGNKSEEGATEGEAEAGLGGRSINVLLTREMYYRMCEFFANTNINDSLKVEIYNNTLQSILSLNKNNFGTGTNNGAFAQGSFQEGGSFVLPNSTRADSLIHTDSDQDENNTDQQQEQKDCTITSPDYPECLNES